MGKVHISLLGMLFIDELTILETESTISKLTEEEEIDYLIKNDSDLLTSYVIIDITDGELKCCSKIAVCL